MNALVLILFLSSPAGAIKPATLEEQAEIQWHIDRANHAVNGKQDKSKRYYYNPTYGLALDKRIELEKAMGLRDSEGNLQRGKSPTPTKEDLKKISGGWFGKDEREEYAKALKICQEAERKHAEELTVALKLTELYYNVIPPPELASGRAINGPPWDRNRSLDWGPLHSRRGEEAESREKDATQDRDGFLRHADGRIVVREEAFQSPGYLAAVLYHETQHHVDFLTGENELDLRNEPLREVQHRWNLLAKHEGVFELSAYHWKQELKNLIWQHDISRMWRDAIGIGKDPYNPDDRLRIFNALRITPDRQREIDRQVEHDLQVLEDALAGGGAGPEALEYIKTNAQSDFFRRIEGNGVLGLAKGWKEARVLEAGRRERESLILVAKAGLEARQCGFEPVIQGDRFIRFRINEGGWGFDYDFTGDRDLEEVKAGFLLARACVSITRDKSVAPPCNDALDAVSRRGADPEFWSDTDLKTRDNQESCMQHLRDNIKPPYDARAFDTASISSLAAYLRRTKQEDEADARRREIERRNREIEERKRRRRDRDESGDGGNDRNHGEPFMPPWARDPWR